MLPGLGVVAGNLPHGRDLPGDRAGHLLQVSGLGADRLRVPGDRVSVDAERLPLVARRWAHLAWGRPWNTSGRFSATGVKGRRIDCLPIHYAPLSKTSLALM